MYVKPGNRRTITGTVCLHMRDAEVATPPRTIAQSGAVPASLAVNVLTSAPVMACLLPFRGIQRHAVACAARVATCRAPPVAQSSVWPAARCLHSQAAPSTLASLTEPDPDVVQTVWPRARQPWSGKNGAAAGHAYLDDSQLWLVTHDLQVRRRSADQAPRGCACAPVWCVC